LHILASAGPRQCLSTLYTATSAGLLSRYLKWINAERRGNSGSKNEMKCLEREKGNENREVSGGVFWREDPERRVDEERAKVKGCFCANERRQAFFGNIINKCIYLGRVRTTTRVVCASSDAPAGGQRLVEQSFLHCSRHRRLGWGCVWRDYRWWNAGVQADGMHFFQFSASGG
jgi:hypothetical protein